jgi:hypothetical protein
MSKVFQYKNGFKGLVSDKVAEILTKKGEGKILEGAPSPYKEPEAKTEAKK